MVFQVDGGQAGWEPRILLMGEESCLRIEGSTRDSPTCA